MLLVVLLAFYIIILKKVMEAKDENKTTTKFGVNASEFINFKSSIKSKNIQKLVISFLNEKNKLYIVKYNKKYQKFLDIDINTYKKKSVGIKIGKNDGYCRIYDLYNMALCFEGEYKNGKKNGKGKEFYKSHEIYENEYSLGEKEGSKLIYEGEYLNGKHHGKGKEYYDNGKLKFEGEFLNGKKWNGIIYNKYNFNYKFEIKNGNGNVKEYDYEGNLLFEGEYINGDKKGKEYEENELIFEGYYLNDKKWSGKIKEYKKGHHWRCGYGRNFERYRDLESEFDKEIKNDKEYEDKILKFEGEYLDGERNGKGKEYDIKGKIIFEGYFLKGKKITRGYSKNKDYDYRYLVYEGEIFWYMKVNFWMEEEMKKAKNFIEDK